MVLRYMFETMHLHCILLLFSYWLVFSVEKIVHFCLCYAADMWSEILYMHLTLHSLGVMQLFRGLCNFCKSSQTSFSKNRPHCREQYMAYFSLAGLY